jgi:hypothetical protein
MPRCPSTRSVTGVRDRLETENGRGRPRIEPQEGTSRILLMITGRRVVMCAICVVWGAPVSFIRDVYTEGHSPATHRRKESRAQDPGEQLYPGDDGVGASLSGRGDDADGGESVGLARKLLPVT